MKLRPLTIASACIAALLAAPSLAGAQAIPPTVTQSMPNMEPMHFLMGSWNCTMPGGTGSLKFTSTMDGMWMLGEGSSALSSSNHTQTARIYLTYDTPMKRWVWMTAQSGGGYGLFYSPGWAGDSMQWKGDSANQSMMMKRTGDAVLEITQNMPDATGYQHMQTFMCRKAS
jgi:hypothetical protein